MVDGHGVYISYISLLDNYSYVQFYACKHSNLSIRGRGGMAPDSPPGFAPEVYSKLCGWDGQQLHCMSNSCWYNVLHWRTEELHVVEHSATVHTDRQTWPSWRLQLQNHHPCLHKIRESRWIMTLRTSCPLGMTLVVMVVEAWSYMICRPLCALLPRSWLWLRHVILHLTIVSIITCMIVHVHICILYAQWFACERAKWSQNSTTDCVEFIAIICWNWTCI